MIIHKPILVVWQESNQFIWNEIFFETLTNYNPGHDILRLFDVWQKFSCHHKWKKKLLVVINMVYMGCLTSCLVLRLPPKIKICQY